MNLGNFKHSKRGSIMFYIDHMDFKNEKYAVADSDDGVIDLISLQEFNEYGRQGIKINTWDEATSLITGRMVRNCNYHLWKKLQRGCSSDELSEYLRKYSVYNISEILNKYADCLDLNTPCKIFDYSQTSNYFIFTIYLMSGNLLAVRVDSDYDVVVCYINGNWHYEKYPSCSGNMLARLFNKFDLNTSGIIADEPYLLLYSSDNSRLLLFRHYDFSINNALLVVNREKFVLE